MVERLAISAAWASAVARLVDRDAAEFGGDLQPLLVIAVRPSAA